MPGADLEIGGTAGLETCATVAHPANQAVCRGLDFND
jgi:hypothetical protein